MSEDRTGTAQPGGLRRRDILRAGGIALVASPALASCDLLGTEPAGTGGPGGPTKAGTGTKEKEAPSLTKQVKEGKIRPLEERLPRNPLIVKPVERTGVYGGTWNDVVSGPSEYGHIYRNIGYDQIMSWGRDYESLLPNIAESLEPADGGREYVMTIREGMRWSDGAPFTVDDLLFTYGEVLMDRELYPVVPAPLLVGGEQVTIEQVNEKTVKFLAVEPHGLFRMYHAEPSGQVLLPRPKHYLKQFMPKYNKDVKALAKKEGYDTWVDLFLAKSGRWENPELPTLNAWTITIPPGEGTRIVAERNPYYWKTDPEGRQLPYLDEVVYSVIQNADVQVLKASHGEIDMSIQWFTNPANKPVLARNRKKGDYDFFESRSDFGNQMIIALNLAHENPKMRELFQNKQFRIGLSLAIDRKEVIQVAFQGQGEPWQEAPRENSPFFLEGFGDQYIEHDPAAANKHLDRAGYTERDGEGFRLLPDSSRISFAIDTIAGARQYWVDALQLIKGYWKKVGVDMRVKTIDRSLLYERKEANKHDANIWNDAGTLRACLLDPRFFFPFSHESNFATPWAKWYGTGGEEGERPPEAPRRQMELYDQLKRSVDRDERDKLFMEILRIAKEEFYVIGIIKPSPGYGIVANDVHNVPDSLLLSWLYVSPGPTRPEQYFISH